MNNIPVLYPAGVEALRDAPLAWALLIGGGAIFLALMALLWLATGARPRPINVRWWLAGGGLALPVVVLGTLQWFNLRHIDRLAPSLERDTLIVSLIGRQWWWELRYTDPASGATIVTANELRLPLGRPVRLGMSSEDVIHSLWIPALAGKVDLLPGRVAQLQLQVDRAGVWRGPCAEFCGQAHARMVLHAVAEPAADFDTWLAEQAKPAREPSDALEVRGRQAFVALRCVSCHSVRGLGAAALPGPDLTHFASRRHIGAGTLANEPQALRRWLTDVQQHKPGARMPSFETQDGNTLDALVAYLSSLR